MLGLKYSIEFQQDNKYRNLNYGTILFVAGKTTCALNEYMRENATQLEETINQDSLSWITCNIVYLDCDNPFFPAQNDAVLYSPMLPAEDNAVQGDSFLRAIMHIENAQQTGKLLTQYFRTLLKLFDDVLDKGTYHSSHIKDFEVPDSWENPAIRLRLLIRETILNKKSASPAPNEERAPKEEQACQEAVGLPTPLYSMLSEEQQSAPCCKIRTPSRLEITPYSYQVLLPDYEREIHFTAQVKALYILFLNHPEGIRLKEIADYKDEYKRLYFCVTNRSDTDKIRNSIDRLLDVCNQNALHVKKSQCAFAIRNAVPEKSLRHYYEISVDRGEAHKIELDRALVTMPECLKSL